MAISYYKDIYDVLSQKYPNRKIYVISDQHFFHSNIILYERSEFPDVETMNNYIINQHNSTVGEDDIVIFLGDFSFKNNEISSLLHRLHGHKYLILGNHDNPNIIKHYGTMGFEGIFTMPVKLNNNYLSHEPLKEDSRDDLHFKLLVKSFKADASGYNYHGHIHTKNTSEEPFHNVTCEALDYIPLFIGYTGGLVKADEFPLIINSERFQNILELLRQEKNIDSNLLLTDYIYSMMLEANSLYSGSCFVYGSFPLYKKFGYVSNFSDLDIALIYDSKISKNRNSQRLKETVDRMYAKVRDFDGINVSFIKRIVNMCAFEALYASKTGYLAKCTLDANLIPHSFYRESDFIQAHDKTTIEKILVKENPELLKGIYLPSYKAQYLVPNGDMANLILQLLFQKGYENKRANALKKLKFVFKHFGDTSETSITELEDILIRFFLRNILFFYTLRRFSEIDYIREGNFPIDKIISGLPAGLAYQLECILINPQSDFNHVFKELVGLDYSLIPTVSAELANIKHK